ncbi:MAG: outer membrane beta-barrel protein [Ignavibacteria bacterium]|nr:outer membrane beta-barrel protein [Ignavibacteria bacterium]
MKTLLILLFSIISLNLFAQDWDEESHDRKYKKDRNKENYFSIGLLGGEYQNFKSPFYEPSYVMNALAIELEYNKNKNFSFFVKGIYQNTYNDIKKMAWLSNDALDIKDPLTYRVIMDFGAKYYTGNKNPRLYFQLGLSHDMLSVGKYSYNYTFEGVVYQHNVEGRQYNNLSIDAGAGLKIRISRKISIDLQYDVYKSLSSQHIGLFANGMLAGVKYDFQ